ncbi:MAG: nuclear transport factor 2 family protein [Candidatus Latescibacterota bacterium]|nr:MAG: nuclear transport factor 2 family protein [Candidatus Latescibacterota bacterium]
MAGTGWIARLFQSIDNRDADTFVTFLSDDVLFRFGNAESVNGKTSVGEVVRGFFDSISALQHDIRDVWEQHDAVVCHGIVTYTRHDSSTLTVPFANVFKMDGELIREYLIFVDVSQLYDSA